MDTTTQFLSIIVLLLTLLLYGVSIGVARRRELPLRDIPAYRVLPQMIGGAIETNRPVHVSAGSAGIGGESTVLMLVSAELFYQVTRRAVIGAAGPLLTTSNSTALPVGYDVLRRAYASRQMIHRFRASEVHWYPSGPRSLAFAAALTALMGDNRVHTNVLAGSFGPELALVMDAAYRRDQRVVAGSNQLEGQAVAYALADEPLIGEEIFMAGAYLDEGRSFRAVIMTQDFLRWILILVIIGLALFTALGGR